ncbi:MAG: NADPH:quinone oxidoreductase family protein [Betaproteobacteria bacterium]|nr:NADPH:quinone oxidoreductase family protein [Betaproteobacteria bacterium]MDH5221662.1 NADPH:quinone oxidoreductase family protein [Betaproteobacteria bacterium]MDH5351897.1 NADPH:quinone oxidoreductase family protein [Betaproteobacteria bacterium]
MKALLCKQFGPPESLVLEDVPSPKAGPGEVVISIKAASVNFPDVLIIQNKYQFKPPLPFSPGSELAGVVKETGAGVASVKPGDRVIAFTTYGAFAEEVKTEATRLLPMPQGMDYASAASFILTYGTTDHALRDRAQLKAGETLLVLGAAGGVGIAAIEVGKALGARVIACASSDEKLAVCREHGADETINYASEDLREHIKGLTAGHGVDVIYDAVGGPYTEPAFRSIAWRGRHLVVGFAAGDIPKLPLNLALLKGASVVGVFWGDFARREPPAFIESARQLVRWFEQGRLRPHVSATFPLEKAAEAMNLLASRKAKGKVVIRIGD